MIITISIRIHGLFVRVRIAWNLYLCLEAQINHSAIDSILFITVTRNSKGLTSKLHYHFDFNAICHVSTKSGGLRETALVLKQYELRRRTSNETGTRPPAYMHLEYCQTACSRSNKAMTSSRFHPLFGGVIAAAAAAAAAVVCFCISNANLASILIDQPRVTRSGVLNVFFTALATQFIRWAVLRWWQGERGGALYGLEHGRLHLQAQTSMWMNMVDRLMLLPRERLSQHRRAIGKMLQYPRH